MDNTRHLSNLSIFCKVIDILLKVIGILPRYYKQFFCSSKSTNSVSSPVTTLVNTSEMCEIVEKDPDKSAKDDLQPTYFTYLLAQSLEECKNTVLMKHIFLDHVLSFPDR